MGKVRTPPHLRDFSRAMRLFNSLPEHQRELFVKVLPKTLVLQHEAVKRLMDICDRWIDAESAASRALARFRNPGKRERNRLIAKHKAAGLTHGQIAKQPDVEMANGGPMLAADVEQALRRLRRKGNLRRES
jgi:hypothetical protein